jgi:membrane-associated phospholipid phosphatase
MKLISDFDQKTSIWIKHELHHPRLSWILSRINRGEVFAIILLPILIWSERYRPLFITLPVLMVFTFFTDRLVLVLKKFFARKRPLISVMGKEDSNPDMKHSFPSAHSANSMVVATILVFGFGETYAFFLFSFFAGVGRLLTLHHFVSDILGGWVIGLSMGLLGIIALKLIQSNSFL